MGLMTREEKERAIDTLLVMMKLKMKEKPLEHALLT